MSHEYLTPAECERLRSLASGCASVAVRKGICRLIADLVAIRESLEWALEELNIEPYEWTVDTQADSHYAAYDAIGKAYER